MRARRLLYEATSSRGWRGGPYATYSPTSGQVGRHDKTKLVDTDARMNIAVGRKSRKCNLGNRCIKKKKKKKINI